jgi:hypothetical protein
VKKVLFAVALVAFLLFAGALSSGALKFGSSGSQAEGVTLDVTQDFGQLRVDSATSEKLPAGETVMRLLQRKFDVGTRYGGGFVRSIEGYSGGTDGGDRVDWFYYVNGIEAPQGAASRKVAAGDVIQWDRHQWDTAQRIPAIVGAFPEPFVSGDEGKRIPVTLVCAGEQRTCDEVSTRLGDAGVDAVSRAGIGTGFGSSVLRIVVGPYPDIRRDPAVRQLEQGPGTSGVFARFRGAAMELLDANGAVRRRLTAGGGLVAATRFQQQQPTWIITGTDDAGVAGAASILRGDVLAHRFAVAVENGRAVPLPVASEAAS